MLILFSLLSTACTHPDAAQLTTHEKHAISNKMNFLLKDMDSLENNGLNHSDASHIRQAMRLKAQQIATL